MRVIGISEKHTTGPKQIVFVVDQDVPLDVVALLEYGSLKFNANGRLLTVFLPDDDADPFTSESVANLNELLNEAVETRNRQKEKRRVMLEKLAITAGLPLVSADMKL